MSTAKATDAVTELMSYVDELFDSAWIPPSLIEAGVAVDPASLRSRWTDDITGLLGSAGLAVPTAGWAATGGRIGHHSEALGQLLSITQSLHRAHPGATW